MGKVTVKEREFHKKSWGFEDWIVNNDLYCGKLLHFDLAGGHTSLHFHAKKHETMFCTKGGFVITVVDPVTAERSEIELGPFESIVIEPNTVHRITAKEDQSVMIEFSTHHEDSDSYRVER